MFKNEWSFEYPRLDGRAYDLFHEALEYLDAGESKNAESELRMLLDGFPEFIDVYHHLAMVLQQTRRQKEARLLWQAAVKIGLDAMPSTFKQAHDRLPWGILENRPFLRAYHSWGLVLLNEGQTEQALAIFEQILSFNPNDNQGIRALAIDCFFRLGKPEKVLALCNRYRNDAMEEVLYGRPLALFQQRKIQQADTALKGAISLLPLVAQELVKKTHRPPKNLSSDYITHGGKDQAYYYWMQQGQHWQNTSGALEWVASALENRKR
jgi:tetratricopeptide (TPR) repeat protein